MRARASAIAKPNSIGERVNRRRKDFLDSRFDAVESAENRARKGERASSINRAARQQWGIQIHHGGTESTEKLISFALCSPCLRGERLFHFSGLPRDGIFIPSSAMTC